MKNVSKFIKEKFLVLIFYFFDLFAKKDHRILLFNSNFNGLAQISLGKRRLKTY